LLLDEDFSFASGSDFVSTFLGASTFVSVLGVSFTGATSAGAFSLT